jgi:FMN-dependent NADH-azoreductase
MAKILHLDSSPLGENSVSRALAAGFVTAWKAAHPADAVVYRDLAKNPVPHVDGRWVAAAFTPQEKRSPRLAADLAVSEALVDEFLAADRYVLSAPMHNFGIPSTLKAYIDQIVRIGRTFGSGYKPLVLGRKMLVITARGGVYPPGTPQAAADLQAPYLRAIFGFIGLSDMSFVHAEGTNMGPEARERGVGEARKRLKDLAASW